MRISIGTVFSIPEPPRISITAPVRWRPATSRPWRRCCPELRRPIRVTSAGAAGTEVEVLTNSQGIARVCVIWPQNFSWWVDAQIEALSTVSGSESSQAQFFNAVAGAGRGHQRYDDASPPNEVSPFGTEQDCDRSAAGPAAAVTATLSRAIEPGAGFLAGPFYLSRIRFRWRYTCSAAYLVKNHASLMTSARPQPGVFSSSAPWVPASRPSGVAWRTISVAEFFDSDAVIEERTGVEISFIFEKEGEDGFRHREQAGNRRADESWPASCWRPVAERSRGGEPRAPGDARSGRLPACDRRAATRTDESQ